MGKTGAHVDPKFEARRRDQARDPPCLQILLDHDPLLPRERAVVGAGNLVLGELIQPHRQALGEPAVVDEDDRRAVLADELQNLRVDRGPDRVVGALLGHGHVVERNDDLEVELLRTACIDELDLARARDEAADLLQRPLRRGQADPLHRFVD